MNIKILVFVIALTFITSSGCEHRGDTLRDAENDVKKAMEKYLYVAPSMEAIAVSATEYYSKFGEWPKTEDDILKDGPLDIEYRRDGQVIHDQLDATNLELELIEIKDGRAHYKAKFFGAEQELDLRPR